MNSLLQELGIRSEHEAAELERDLGVRFIDFTPEDCDTWIRQSVYLNQYARTHVISFAADEAGVTITTALHWQTDNTLGFKARLEIAILRYTDVLEVLLLERARQPDSPPTFLTTLIRGQMPEKYGPARRSSAPRDNNHCDHDQHTNPTVPDIHSESLADLRRELEDLQRLTGVDQQDPTPQPDASDLSPTGEDTSHSNLSPAGEDTSHSNLSPAGEDTSHSDLSPAGGEIQRGGSSPPPDDHGPLEDNDLDRSPFYQAPLGAGFKPSPVLSPAGEETHGDHAATIPQQPAPRTQNLNRRQRRQLQRETKRQKSHRARAPN